MAQRLAHPEVPVPLSEGLWHNGVSSGVASSRSILARRTPSSSFAAVELPSSSLPSSQSTKKSCLINRSDRQDEMGYAGVPLRGRSPCWRSTAGVWVGS